MPQDLEGRACSRRLLLSGIILATVTSGGLGSPAAHAQTAPDLSIIDRRVKEGEKTPPRRIPVPVPRIEGAAPPAAAMQPFTLSGVIIEGATVFKPADFTKTYEKYLATRVGDPEIEAILRGITQRYDDEGYFLARAIAPAQDITAGILRIRVIEGTITKFTPAGDYPYPKLLAKYAQPVLGEHPARLPTVERVLLLMSDLPGVTVKPRLKPLNAEAGEYELIADVDYRPVRAFGRLDNRGTPDVGRLQGWLGAGLNGVLGFGESINATFVTVPNQPKELLYGSLSGTLPVGHNGAYVSLYGAQGAIDAGGNSAQFDTNSTSTQAIGRAGYPLMRSRAQNLWINGTFDYRDFHQTQFDQTTIEDRLRVLRGGLSYNLNDRFDGESQAGVEVSEGLGIMGASKAGSNTLSRTDGHSQFTKISANAARLQKITRHVSVRVAAAGQWSADPLLAYEQFSLGGEYFGRGYDYGERTGDDGVAGSGEIRYGSEMNWRWLSEYQFYGFYDIGAVWNKSSADGPSSDHLSSAGGGLRLRLNDSVRAGLEAAKPLDQRVDSTGDRDWRVFFTLIANY